MRKTATIIITEESDGTTNVKVCFDPDVRRGMMEADHIPATLAIAMLDAMKKDLRCKKVISEELS